MKPRLEPLDHTDEDSMAWADVLLRYAERHGGTLWTRSLMQDRRDADLMFEAQRLRSYTFPVDLPPLVLIGSSGHIDCGGALEWVKALNITYFA
jgi:hypothetical protein